MQQIGALAVKQAVYVLPDSPGAREDFEWLKTDIESAGGQASLFAADTVDSWSHDALVDEFRRSRQEAYSELAREAEETLRRAGPSSRRSRHMPSRRVVQQLRERLAAIETSTSSAPPAAIAPSRWCTNSKSAWARRLQPPRRPERETWHALTAERSGSLVPVLASIAWRRPG